MPVTKKHDFTKKEIVAGLTVIVTALVFFGFVALIQGLRPPKETNEYHARFTNTIGLKKNAEVRFGGMLVGKVLDIKADPEERDKIRVSAAIDPGLPINEESIATIETISLTTDKHLEISTGKTDAAVLPTGSTIKSVTKSGGFVDIPNVEGLISGSEDLVSDLRDMLGVQEAKKEEEAGKQEMASVIRVTQDVRNLLGVQQATTDAAAGGKEMPSVTKITQDVRDLMGVQEARAAEAAGTGELIVLTDITSSVDGLFERYQPELDKIIAKVPGMQDSVQKLLDELNAALSDNRGNIDTMAKNVAEITEKLNAELEGMMKELDATLKNTQGLTGDLQQFVADNRPVLEDLLGDLSQAVQNLGVFLQQLKNQPQSIVWGKPAQGRKP